MDEDSGLLTSVFPASGKHLMGTKYLCVEKNKIKKNKAKYSTVLGFCTSFQNPDNPYC